jgi:hypothetical protein
MVLPLENVLSLADQLSIEDKIQLIEALAASLKRDIQPKERQPLPSVFGLLADLGSGPSTEDIDDARREIWGNFPREDIL